MSKQKKDSEKDKERTLRDEYEDYIKEHKRPWYLL